MCPVLYRPYQFIDETAEYQENWAPTKAGVHPRAGAAPPTYERDKSVHPCSLSILFSLFFFFFFLFLWVFFFPFPSGMIGPSTSE